APGQAVSAAPSHCSPGSREPDPQVPGHCARLASMVVQPMSAQAPLVASVGAHIVSSAPRQPRSLCDRLSFSSYWQAVIAFSFTLCRPLWLIVAGLQRKSLPLSLQSEAASESARQVPSMSPSAKRKPSVDGEIPPGALHASSAQASWALSRLSLALRL